MMKNYLRIALVTFGALILQACSHQDSEAEAHANDAPKSANSNPPKGSSAEASPPGISAPTPKRTPSKRFNLDPNKGDGSDTFVYKPDPRLLKQLDKDKAK